MSNDSVFDPDASMSFGLSHTPGPWLHSQLSDEIIAADGQPIASPPENYDEDQWAANAPVLAAAADLLAIVKAFEQLITRESDDHGFHLHVVPISIDAVTALRATIAKAERRGR